VAVQALNGYDRVGGVFSGTTPVDIQAQNVKLQAQVAALTHRLDDADTAAGLNKVAEKRKVLQVFCCIFEMPYGVLIMTRHAFVFLIKKFYQRFLAFWNGNQVLILVQLWT
jgi:hypothetical protein